MSATTDSVKATIGELCELVNGRAFKPTEWTSSGLPIIRIQNLNDDTKEFNYFEGDYSKKHEVNDGDLLFSWSGTPGTSFGAFFWNRGRGVLNQHIFNVLIDKKRVEKRYFRYAINSRLNEIISHAHGGVGLQHITKGKLESVEIPLPPLSEQKRIADILDKADAIRRKRQEAEALLASARSAVFHHRFGDPVANPKSWNVVELQDLFEAPPNYGTMIKPSDEVKGWLDLRVANIQEGKLDISSRKYVDLPEEMIERHEVREGDLLLARAIGSIEHLGKCIIAHPEGQKWAFDSHLMRIRFDTTRVLPRFVHAFLQSPGGRHEFLRNSRRSAVQFNINTKEMACIRMPLPPLDEQQQFIAELDLVDQLANRQYTASHEHECLFNCLVQRAFRGEL